MHSLWNYFLNRAVTEACGLFVHGMESPTVKDKIIRLENIHVRVHVLWNASQLLIREHLRKQQSYGNHSPTAGIYKLT